MRFCLHLIGVLMSKMKRFYMQDALLQMERGFGYHDNEPEDFKEYRYEERGDSYRLRCWRGGREIADGGRIADRPEWLVRIIDVAKIGGHLSKVLDPPPTCIVWFKTDANNNLHQFRELNKQ